MTLRIAFRTDASLQIGSGHVMRCLTLADALRARGEQCHFISRAHTGHLLEHIRQRGYKVNSLLAPVDIAQAAIKKISSVELGTHSHQPPEPAHAAWLGSTWQADAIDTAAVLASLQPDWLVVDHYALDHRWESALQPHYKKLIVIDDLADRAHKCDLLLDQNLGRQPQDYAKLVPVRCQVLTGPQFALLRPEFAALRPYSLQRRQSQANIGKLLITMGGVDQDNATGQVLQALKACAFLPADCRITVVMGLTAPCLQNVRELAAQMPWPTDVVVNVNDMAQRMADSDLAIGAAGGTSWERCCLGLPTLMVVLAENQQPGTHALEAAHAARLIGTVSDIATQLPLAVRELIGSACRKRMSRAASAVTDGQGVDKILTATRAVHA
jgi:UDP-2,4-diacetamido-2,4,6-trideoxy-beta-L-altropyranose hydrolase